MLSLSLEKESFITFYYFVYLIFYKTHEFRVENPAGYPISGKPSVRCIPKSYSYCTKVLSRDGKRGNSCVQAMESLSPSELS
jgi:hypothetical protein